MVSLNANLEAAVAGAAAVISLLALLGVALAARANRRLRARSRSLESSLDALRREMELAASVSSRAVRRLQRIEQVHAAVSDRLRRVERSASRCFDQAIDSARRGTDVSGLSERFGLSRAEAELVARLHGRPTSA